MLKTNAERLDMLVETIKRELTIVPESFEVKLIQLYYNDAYEIYQDVKEEDLTTIVCV